MYTMVCICGTNSCWPLLHINLFHGAWFLGHTIGFILPVPYDTVLKAFKVLFTAPLYRCVLYKAGIVENKFLAFRNIAADMWYTTVEVGTLSVVTFACNKISFSQIKCAYNIAVGHYRQPMLNSVPVYLLTILADLSCSFLRTCATSWAHKPNIWEIPLCFHSNSLHLF